MRILLLHNRYLERGGEDAVYEAERDLLLSHGNEVVTFEMDNTKVAEIGRLRTAARSIWSQESYREIRSLLQNKKFDVIHVHNFFPLLSPAIYYAAKAERVPIVQTLHNYRLLCPIGTFNRNGEVCEKCVGRAFPWPGVWSRCYRNSAAATASVGAMTTIHKAAGTWNRMVDAYIVLTQFMRNKFLDAGMPPEKLFVKPNFLSPDPLPGDHSGNFGLFVGRLSPEKGINTLLDAWRRIGNDFKLKIVGSGPLTHLLDSPDLPASVEYMGWQSLDNVMALMGNAKFLVLPSVCYEGHPVTAVEAFARQLPIIGSEIGAIAEIIEDGKTGILFKPGDAADLADKIRWAINNSDTISEIGKRSRREFEKCYIDEVNYKQLIDIYKAAGRNSRTSK